MKQLDAVKTKAGERGVLDQYLGIGELLRFETLTLFRTKQSKIHTLFRTTPSILLPCLGQMTNCRPSCF